MPIAVGEQVLASDVLALVTNKLKPPTVRWAAPGWAWTAEDFVGVVTLNRIYYMPVYVEEDTTYIRIGIYVQAGSGDESLADLRIFEWSDGVPVALVLSCGTVANHPAGAKEIVIAQLLPRGYYFLAVRCAGTPVLSGISLTNISKCPVSGMKTSNAQNGMSGVVLYDDDVYSDPAGVVDGSLDCRSAFLRLREV